MESIALFEEKIPLTPRDLSKSKIDIEKLLKKIYKPPWSRYQD